MAKKREARPWYRPSRSCWYITLDGKQHKLGDCSESEAWVRADALKRQLKQEASAKAVSSDSLAAIIDAFLEWTEKHRAPDTYEWYRYRLQRFIDRYPDLDALDVRPHHVQTWVDSYELSKTSRRNYLRSVKRCMAWAAKQGYIETSPLRHLEVPSADHKEVVISPAEFDELLTHFKNQDFKDLLRLTWETGCRPQESLRVEARHVDLDNSRWVFPVSEGKTGLRIVYLTEEALLITKRLMLKYPKGKLFRNRNGKAWTTDAVNCRFYYVQQKTGKRYSLYALRHSWATHALRKGLDPLTVAILMGHKDPSMLSRVYQHLSLSPEHMLEQAKRAAG